jgi:putative membrane protein
MKTTIKGLAYLLLAGSMTLTACGDSTETTSSTTTTNADSNTAVLTEDSNNTGAANGATGSNTASNQNRDQEFVMEAMGLNMAEVEAHTAATTRATTTEVKAHAKHMLADHKKMGDEMTALAKKKNLQMPTAAPEDKRKNLEDMNRDKKGAEWDRAYLSQQVDDHQTAIDKFEDAQDDVTDPELKALITKTLPTLRSHLQMVKDAKDKMK